MSSLAQHHKIIIDFLGDVRERAPDAFSYIPPDSDDWKLLKEVISSGICRKKQHDTAMALGIQKHQLTRLVKSLNGYLRSFPSGSRIFKYPIQLYYRSDAKGYPGGHFACCKSDSDSGISCHFIKLSELENQITAARRDLEIDTQLEILKLNPKYLEYDERNERHNLFRFEYCWPKLAGRDEEMRRLFDFVNSKDGNLLWWSITGKGGTGKSRLALELCLELNKQNWNTGFLDHTIGADIWRNWKPQRSTLIVVDYNFEKAKEFGEHVGNKYEESKQWNHPVRILILQRNEDSDILKKFCSQYRELFNANIRYNEIQNENKDKTLKLKGLEDKYIDSVITEVFNRYSKIPSVDNVIEIKSFLKGKGHDNRPLYAIFVTDACARGEDVRGWDIDKLHESVLEHNKNIWKRGGIDEYDDLDKKHINLLTLATMTNGINIKDNKYNECLKNTLNKADVSDILPATRIFSNSKYQILCDDEVGKELSPMTPDILGEYFVLQRWKGGVAEGCVMELLTEIAWHHKPWGVIDFVTRLAIDFPTDEKVDEIVGLLTADNGHYLDRAVLLFILTADYSNTKNFSKATEYYLYLEELWKSGYQDDNNVILVLVSAAMSLLCKYADVGDIDKAVMHYNRIEDLWRSGYQKDAEITFVLIGATINLIYYYCDTGKIDKAVKYYNRIVDMWNSGYQKDVDVSIAMADAEKHLTYYYGEAGEIDKAVMHYNRIVELWNNGYQKDVDISIAMADAEKLLTYYYGEAGEIDKAVMHYNRIVELWNNGYRKNEGVSIELAKAASHLTCFGSRAVKFDIAIKYFNNLDNLWNSGYQKNEEITLQLAESAKQITYYYGDNGEIDEAVKYYNRIYDLWRSGYQNNKSISIELAGATVNLIYFYSEAKDVGIATRYYNRIVDLWNNGYQNDKNISNELAEAAKYMICIYGEVGDIGKATNCYNNIKHIWNSGYQKDEGISIELAEAAKHMICLYGEVGEIGKATNYYNNIEHIWNSGYQKDEGVSIELAEAAGMLSKYATKYNNRHVIMQYKKRVVELFQIFPKNEEIELLYTKYVTNDK